MNQDSKKEILKKGASLISTINRPKKIFRILVALMTLYIVFFDNNGVIVRFINARQINRLKSEISFYENKIEESKQRVKELNSSRENLEKFAREQLLMKRKNEDIFLVDHE